MAWNGNSDIFKTYVKGRDKRPAEKVKGRESISTFDEVKDFDSFGGILNDGYIDISFDSKEMYESFLKMAEANEWRCLALPSTKGGHTYWRTGGRSFRSAADQKLAVGLVADIHKGSTYIPLKVRGVERFPPDYDKYAEENYQVVPEELLPVDTSVSLWQMKDGDSRNSSLYKYILVLQSQLSLPAERIRQVLNNVNKFILADQLPEKELDTILRDEAFEQPAFFKGKTFLHDVFGNWMIEKHHIININNQLHIYKDGVYVPDLDTIKRSMQQEIPTLRESNRLEALRYMMLMADRKKRSDARYIAFKNGILDIKTCKIVPFSTDIVITNQIPWNYNPDAESPLADQTLDNIACGDPDIRALLEECIGYTFFRRNELRKAFILTGGRRGGKSTYLDCIKAILGEDNICSLDIKELGDRFSTATMFGKLANIGDDIGDDFLQGSQVAVFKRVVAGNRIKAEHKGLEPFEFDPYVKLLFSANEIPRMRDRGGAVIDRLIIIPFNAVFDKSQQDYDPFLKYRLIEKDSIEYLIKLGVQGLRRILEDNRGFTRSGAVETQLQEYNEANNPVLAFLKMVDIEADIINVPTKDVYRRYKMFCMENEFTPLAINKFSAQVNGVLKTESRKVRLNGGRPVWVYDYKR